MSPSQPTHISIALPGAIANIARQANPAIEAAGLDPSNPNALVFWTEQLRLISQYPDGEAFFRACLSEIRMRRTAKTAARHRYNGAVEHPARWLYSTLHAWINRRADRRRP